MADLNILAGRIPKRKYSSDRTTNTSISPMQRETYSGIKKQSKGSDPIASSDPNMYTLCESPPKSLLEMKKLKKSKYSPSKDAPIKLENNSRDTKKPSTPVSSDKDIEKTISKMFFSQEYYGGGNIAEKVKLSRRKAAMKKEEVKQEVAIKKPIQKKKRKGKTIKQNALSSPTKKSENAAVAKGDEKKKPLRISLKMNLATRIRLLNNAKVAREKAAKASRKVKRPPTIVQIKRKKKKRVRVSESESNNSSSSSDSDSDSSSEDSGSDSDSESGSSDSDSSSSDSSDSSSDSSDSESENDAEVPTKKRKLPVKKAMKEAIPAKKLKVRGKPKERPAASPPTETKYIEFDEEEDEKECFSGKCSNPPGSEKPLSAAEIRAILGEDFDQGDTGSSWVRRSTRQPSRSAANAPNVRAVVGKLEMNDPDMVVLKCKKYLPSSDTASVIVDALLDALEKNTNCQALYIQNFNTGMKDEQVLHLLRILQQPSCKIWCLNIGETYNVKRRTWAAFTNGLKQTKITHMYASEHTISGAMKEKIREIIRDNRKKHNMHIDPNNLEVIVQCTHCWWNPINARVLQPYVRQRGYEHILQDKVAQGSKDIATTDSSNI